MYKTALAVALPANQNDNPFKALVESTANTAALVFDFMYGTPERCKITYIFAIGMSLLGLGMESSQAVASMQDCPVASL